MRTNTEVPSEAFQEIDRGLMRIRPRTYCIALTGWASLSLLNQIIKWVFSPQLSQSPAAIASGISKMALAIVIAVLGIALIRRVRLESVSPIEGRVLAYQTTSGPYRFLLNAGIAVSFLSAAFLPLHDAYRVLRLLVAR